MKKLLLTLSLILVTLVSIGQTFTPDVVNHGLRYSKSKSLKAPHLKSGIMGDYTLPMTLKTPALQLTFTQVEKVDGSYKLTTPIYVGYSYVFSYAHGVIHQDSSITVENRFFFGAGANFGVKPNENGTLVGSVPVGAILGYSRYGLFGGVDVLTGKPLVAVSVNLFNVPILQSLTRFNVKQ